VQNDWLDILTECKKNVQKQIAPLLKTVKNLQPNLGIGAGGDPIKQVDLAAENAIAEVLGTHLRNFTLISEESGFKKIGEKPDECYVTTDPIDGTTNVFRGIPFYATSIAVSLRPSLKTVHSALVADLFHDITYTAQKGKGAWRNGKPAISSANTSLNEGVIGLDLNSYRIKQLAPRLNSLIEQTKHIRHFGANALELCYVADGTTDAFIDIRGKLRTTDMAAAWLILNEAGGKITSSDGEPLDVDLDPKQNVEFVAAANSGMHEAILNLIG
jgi:myo-inositol-1(or 4)-monophosphatase